MAIKSTERNRICIMYMYTEYEQNSYKGRNMRGTELIQDDEVVYGVLARLHKTQKNSPNTILAPRRVSRPETRVTDGGEQKQKLVVMHDGRGGKRH